MLKKIACLWLLLPAVACAETIVLKEISVPQGHHQFLTLHAKGEQIYQCISQQGAYSWQLQRPAAQLFDEAGHKVGSHSAGPEWTYQDGSRVTGRVVNKFDVTPNSAVAWVLLEAVNHHGEGVLANSRFIQRVKTHGGLPPASDCNSNHLGMEKPVAYSADYIFYTR